jgi:hypothetical protein
VGSNTHLLVQNLSLISYPTSGGEFGWGGTPAISQRRCPKGSSDGTEIPPRTKGYKLPSLTRAFSELYRESVAYRSFDEEPILPEVSEKLPQGWNDMLVVPERKIYKWLNLKPNSL